MDFLPRLSRLFVRTLLVMAAASLALVGVGAQPSGGSFVPSANYTVTGDWVFTQPITVASCTGCGSGGSGAPTDATYLTQTANASLSAEQALSTLATGLMRVATTTGVVTSLTDSAGLAANISNETGSGALVFGTSPTLVTPTLGVATATTLDTGQGANELYDMDQNVLIASSPTFANLTDSGLTAGRVPIVSTAGLLADDAGLLFNSTLNALVVSDILAVGPGMDPTDQDAFGKIQLASTRTIADDPGYTVGQYTQSVMITGGDASNSTLNPSLVDARVEVNHALSEIIGHDHPMNIVLANAVTVGFASQGENDLFVSGSGTITEQYINYGSKVITGVTIASLYDYFVGRPNLSGGGAITNFYGFAGDDLGPLTVAGVKHFIDYAEGVFFVDSAGVTKAAGLRLTMQTPATAGAACTKDTFAFDTGFVYVCTATNTWKRAAIATW